MIQQKYITCYRFNIFAHKLGYKYRHTRCMCACQTVEKVQTKDEKEQFYPIDYVGFCVVSTPMPPEGEMEVFGGWSTQFYIYAQKQQIFSLYITCKKHPQLSPFSPF